MLANLLIGLLFSLIQFLSPAGITTSDIVIDSFSVDYLFGSYMEFQLTVGSEQVIDKVVVYTEIPYVATTAIRELQPTGEPNQFAYIQDLKQDPLPGFSTLNYWFEITSESGETTQTVQQSLEYLDNRFEWETLTANHFQVNWYGEDLAFGQRLLNAVQVGDIRIKDYIEMENNQSLEVYAYANHEDMRLTLNDATNDWVIGHANPAIGVVIVTLPPGPDREWEIDRQIPHEIAHLYLYRKLGEGYYNLPRWLNEGLASINENVINPDYRILLNHANDNNQLIPIENLCSSFPQNASDFVLSYAEAAYFTDFIFSKYGKDGLNTLLIAYANGADCEGGLKSAFGISISELETQWKRSVFSDSSLQMDNFPNLLPWILILGVILLLPVLIIILNSIIKPKETATDGGK